MRSLVSIVLPAMLCVAVPALCQDAPWQATLLVNAAGAGNLNEHQARYDAASPAIVACAAENAPVVADAAPGAYSMWVVSERAGEASTPVLHMEGVLTPADDGGNVWGDEVDVLGEALSSCITAALAAIEGGDGGDVIVSVELLRGTP